MATQLFLSGGKLPDYSFPLVGGDEGTFNKVDKEGRWQVVVVYRGLHCPLCKQYLKKLDELKGEFLSSNAEILVVSGDPQEKAQEMVKETGVSLRVGYGMTTDQMKSLGLYISEPRSADETDRPFAEPGMFAVNSDGLVQLIDISNTPFNRAELTELLDTVQWIQENDYPIRGTFQG